MSTELLTLDMPSFDVETTSHGSTSLARTVGDISGQAPSANWPSLPSLLRKANRRYLMNRIDTNSTPDFATLTDISYDHDLFTALGMISLDTIKGMLLGSDKDDSALVSKLEDLDARVDIPDQYRNTAYDVLRYGNSITKKRLEDGVFVDFDIIHPGRIYNMKLGPDNKPMWWVFKSPTDEYLYKNNSDPYIAYVNPKYESRYRAEGFTDNIVGEADEIVHFKGDALRYQTWGVGISQIAKVLIETKIDMLVDFSKIIKMNTSPKEYIYVNVEGLRDGPAQDKIQKTIESVTQQRMLSSVIVLGKDEAEAKIIGSEGKVLDNFTLHYRDDVLRAIRILTRVPPSFWLGEATNKATINSQVTVYNGFIEGNRWFESRQYERELFYPYLKQFDSTLKIGEVPKLTFIGPPVQDPMDKMVMDDIAIRNGSKSRHQVADEWKFRLPEDDNELPPNLGGGQSQLAEIIKKDKISQELKPDV